MRATEWKKLSWSFKDGNTSFPFCKGRDWQCLNYTEFPAPRSGHSALVYNTYTEDECIKYV